MKVEEIFRFALKLAQFFVTFLLLYAIGFPYWMIVAAALLVPIYGIYLMFRSPGKTKGGTPYADYKLNAIARSWHKVDISLCITMAVVCLIFALLLFFFYFMFSTFTTKILLSACCSLLLSILYALNGILVTRKLQSGTIDFPATHKLFTTSTSRSSPLTQKHNDKALDLFGSSRKRDESLSKYSESKNRRNSNAEEITIRRKSAVPSPEPPKSPTDDEVPYNFQTTKLPLSQQYSVERRPRVTSWFTDVGDNNKKDISTTIESSFMTPNDASKEGDHLDAREQYIKSKQYRDFMDPNPNKKGIAKKSSAKIQEKTMEDFNEKFAAITTSNENLEKQQQIPDAPALLFGSSSTSVVNEKNYKLGTTPYTRKPMPAESRKESEEYLHKPFQQSILVKKQQQPLTNNFDASHSSHGSYWSSQTELDKAFAHKKQSYTERAIDIGSYKASPVEVFDADRKHSDTHSSGTLHSLDDVEATPKAPRQALSYPPSYPPPSSSNFDISASTTKSRRSIGVDDSPGTPIKYKIKETHSEFHEMPPARIAIKSAVIPQKGVITGIARPYSFQGQSREDLSSTPSRSISSLTGSSSQIRNSEVAESTASSTIRVDDIDRGNTKSPLRDNSLMTTSTIVNMNSTSIRDWSSSSSSSNTDSRKDSQLRIQNSRTTPQKQGFDVIIRPRDSPIDNNIGNRPQSVTPSTSGATTTEFVPRYTNSATTLTIKSSPDYSQNRHLSTQF